MRREGVCVGRRESVSGEEGAGREGEEEEGRGEGVGREEGESPTVRLCVEECLPHLLFAEAAVDDAAGQVVQPLPLHNVLQDHLPARAGRQGKLAWGHVPHSSSDDMTPGSMSYHSPQNQSL